MRLILFALIISSLYCEVYGQNIIPDSVKVTFDIDSTPKPSDSLVAIISQVVNNSSCTCPGNSLFLLTIDQNGVATQASLIRQVNGDWPMAVLHVLKGSTGWQPALKQGIPVEATFVYPLYVGTVFTDECCYNE